MAALVPDSAWVSPLCFLLWIYSLGSTFSGNSDSPVSSSCLLPTNYPEMEEKVHEATSDYSLYSPFSKGASVHEMEDVAHKGTWSIPLSVFRLTVTNPSSTPCLLLLSRPTTGNGGAGEREIRDQTLLSHVQGKITKCLQIFTSSAKKAE